MGGIRNVCVLLTKPTHAYTVNSKTFSSSATRFSEYIASIAHQVI